MPDWRSEPKNPHRIAQQRAREVMQNVVTTKCLTSPPAPLGAGSCAARWATQSPAAEVRPVPHTPEADQKLAACGRSLARPRLGRATSARSSACAVQGSRSALARQMLGDRPLERRRRGHRRRESGDALACRAQHPNRTELRPTRPDPRKTSVVVRAQGVKLVEVEPEARVRRNYAALRRQGSRCDRTGGPPRAPLPNALEQPGRERVHRHRESGRHRRLPGRRDVPVGVRPPRCEPQDAQNMGPAGPQPVAQKPGDRATMRHPAAELVHW